MIRHHQVDGWMVRKLLSSWISLSNVCGLQCSRRFRDVFVWRCVLQLNKEPMFDAYIYLCVVGVNPYFVGDHLLCEPDEYLRIRLAKEGWLVSHFFISISQRSGVMASHSVAGWMFANRKGRLAYCRLTSPTMGVITISELDAADRAVLALQWAWFKRTKQFGRTI